MTNCLTYFQHIQRRLDAAKFVSADGKKFGIGKSSG